MKEIIMSENKINYYNEIKNKLIDNEVYEIVKDYSKERNRVITYYEVGRILSEAGKHYGENIIGEYSKKLMIEVGKKYNRRTLFRMKQFYGIFNNQKVSTAWTQITWSHIRLLFGLEENGINYYIKTVIKENLSVRELIVKLNNKEYERLPKETRNKFASDVKETITDYVKNPIIIKNNINNEIITEKVLQRLILEDIPFFLKELGSGFTFIDNEYKIRLGNRYNYIDLLLYNIRYRCYVVVELKVTELKKEHIGQIMIYMNYFDENIKRIEDNKTIGIIICKENNNYVIKYCSDKRIISRTYELV